MPFLMVRGDIAKMRTDACGHPCRWRRTAAQNQTSAMQGDHAQELWLVCAIHHLRDRPSMDR